MSALMRWEKPEVNAKINLSFLPSSFDVESYEPFVLLIGNVKSIWPRRAHLNWPHPGRNGVS